MAGLDHLVVAARTLEEGVQWCEATLGVTPGPGGEHALFGTHNRLLRLGDGEGPVAEPPPYLEIIAINPAAQPARAAPLKRWFDLDDEALQARLAQQGPQLIHWVARVDRLDAVLAAWDALGLQRGAPIAASRATPQGLLEWRLTVRDDGARLLDGCLPTLIAWGPRHPVTDMPVSGLKLKDFRLLHPDAQLLTQALQVAGLGAVPVQATAAGAAAAGLCATLTTPRGEVVLG
ncbi:MAG: VOC family protein [Serpentinimonas sp.]|nr:VOC family protein [Serpentinimonas sp.]